MPRPPPLYNADVNLGPRIWLYVLGYCLSSDALKQWADSEIIAPDKSENNRRQLVWNLICQRLPPKCRQREVVSLGHGLLGSCIVVATNCTQQELNRAEDLETVNVVSEVVRVRAAPVWYPIWQ
jgi:hypothetical protein